jgi:hypothetical protein
MAGVRRFREHGVKERTRAARSHWWKSGAMAREARRSWGIQGPKPGAEKVAARGAGGAGSLLRTRLNSAGFAGPDHTHRIVFNARWVRNVAWRMCGRRRDCKSIFCQHWRSVGCGHVSGLLMRHMPLALMKFADRVPIKSAALEARRPWAGCSDPVVRPYRHHFRHHPRNMWSGSNQQNALYAL